jgi:hypothetical protein
MTDRAKVHQVDAELNYMAPMADRPRYLAYDQEPGEARSNMATILIECSLLDNKP